MSDLFGDRERRSKILGFLLRVLGVAIAIGLVFGLGSLLIVKGLGLNSMRVSNPGSGPVGPITPLPTTALPVPTRSAVLLPSNESSPKAVTIGGLYLKASPVLVKAMERINLTGEWSGHDSLGLLVQRFEGGLWSDFGAKVEVRFGTFGTYVFTSHLGKNRFRVFDPSTKTSSNVVTVTIR